MYCCPGPNLHVAAVALRWGKHEGPHCLPRLPLPCSDLQSVLLSQGAPLPQRRLPNQKDVLHWEVSSQPYLLGGDVALPILLGRLCHPGRLHHHGCHDFQVGLPYLALLDPKHPCLCFHWCLLRPLCPSPHETPLGKGFIPRTKVPIEHSSKRSGASTIPGGWLEGGKGSSGAFNSSNLTSCSSIQVHHTEWLDCVAGDKIWEYNISDWHHIIQPPIWTSSFSCSRRNLRWSISRKCQSRQEWQNTPLALARLLDLPTLRTISSFLWICKGSVRNRGPGGQPNSSLSIFCWELKVIRPECVTWNYCNGHFGVHVYSNHC